MIDVRCCAKRLSDNALEILVIRSTTQPNVSPNRYWIGDGIRGVDSDGKTRVSSDSVTLGV